MFEITFYFILFLTETICFTTFVSPPSHPPLNTKGIFFKNAVIVSIPISHTILPHCNVLFRIFFLPSFKGIFKKNKRKERKRRHICLKVELKMLLEQWRDDLLSFYYHLLFSYFPEVLAREGVEFFSVGLNKFDMKFCIED